MTTETMDVDVDMEAGVGDVPPHDQDAEQAVLGSIMLSPDAANDLLDSLTPTDFYVPRHGLVFQAALALRAESLPVDAITVSTRLRELGDLARAGGAPYLHTLLAAVPTTANSAHYATIVREHAWKRRMIEHSAYVKQQVTSGVGIDEARERIDSHYARCQTAQTAARVDVMGDWWESFLESSLDPVGVQYLSTGLSDLDRQCEGGLAPGQVVIVAGRPGMGKTVMLAQFGREIAREQGVLMVTLEQTRDDIVQRLIAAEGGIPHSAIRQKPWNDALTRRVMAVAPSLPMANMAIEHTASTIGDIRRLAHMHHRQRGIKALVVDYLQLVKSAGRHQSREQEVAEISRQLKLLALELNIVVIVGSQFNRGPENRPDKRPQLADLRESGSIEQDSDIVILLHREDAYDDQSPRQGEIDLVVAKNRNGATGTVVAAAQLHLMRVRSLAK